MPCKNLHAVLRRGLTEAHGSRQTEIPHRLARRPGEAAEINESGERNPPEKNHLLGGPACDAEHLLVAQLEFFFCRESIGKIWTRAPHLRSSASRLSDDPFWAARSAPPDPKSRR